MHIWRVSHLVLCCDHKGREGVVPAPERRSLSPCDCAHNQVYTHCTMLLQLKAKQHVAFVQEVRVTKDVLLALQGRIEGTIAQDASTWDSRLSPKSKALVQSWDTLVQAVEARTRSLEQLGAWVQFVAQADTLATWIAEKFADATKTTDCGDNVESCERHVNVNEASQTAILANVGSHDALVQQAAKLQAEAHPKAKEALARVQVYLRESMMWKSLPFRRRSP